MSTRYVWEKFEIAQKFKTIRAEQMATSPQRYSMGRLVDYNGDEIYGAVAFSKEFPDGNVIDQVNLSSDRFGVGGKRVAFSDNRSFPEDPQGYYAYIWGAGTLYIENGIVYASNPGDDSSEVTAGPYVRKKVQEKGSSLGYASSATDGAYPADGVSGNVWYTKQGSDNIDPSACSIPSTIMGGTQIQITVTPGTGKVYEGTVSYLYQVKLGDADWTTIATTTATSKNYTVPYGTTTFQVRVRAQDNLGFTSTDYVTSSSVTVINNQPPTAPGSIEVTNVVHGQQATITITAATDPDGTVESYIYERSVDGSAFTQIANVNALSQTDQVSADWGTVAYRVCAVDDDGDSGPYVTSETTTVNSGWIIISGPAADMGDKPAPFNFTFTPNVTGQTGVTDISVVVTLDGEEIYNDTPDAGQEVSIPIDTRLMRAGEHTIQVAASKEDFLEASGSYEFNIPAITLPDGGIAEMLQNPEGKVIFPYTLARLVIGKDGKDLNRIIEDILGSAVKVETGTYVGTGTYGSGSPNVLYCDSTPMLLLIVAESTRFSLAINTFVGGSYDFGVSSSDAGDKKITMNWGDNSVSWYGDTEAYQMNSNGNRYTYFLLCKQEKSPIDGSIPVILETDSFSESENIIWNFSIPEGITILTGGSKSVTVTMTRGGSATTWTQGRYVTYTVEGADGSGKTANGLVRASDGDPAPTFSIPISNVSGDTVKIKITNVSANG